MGELFVRHVLFELVVSADLLEEFSIGLDEQLNKVSPVCLKNKH